MYEAEIIEILGEGLEHPLQRVLTDSALEAPVASLVRWVAHGQIGPPCSGPQDPQDAIQRLAAAAPGSSAPVGASRHITDKRFEYLPLFVCQIHRRYIRPLDAAYYVFMR